jgi:hypothetical protein
MDHLAQVGFGGAVIAELEAGFAEIAEKHQFTVAVANLACDRQRILKVRERRLVIATGLSDDSPVVQQVFDLHAVAQGMADLDGLFETLLGLLKMPQDVVRHAKQVQAASWSVRPRRALLPPKSASRLLRRSDLDR